MDLGDVRIYHGGKYKAYRDAKVGLLTHGLNYGTGCFEGIRGYWNADEKQLYFFRLADHFDRMRASANLLLITLPASTKALCDHTVELARLNDYHQDVYVRPIAFKAAEEIGVRLHNVKDDFAIIAVPHTAYFDATQGLKVCVASWRRIDDNSAPARAKLTGVYVSSALAKTEAVMNGFDEAILLSGDGHVSEGSAENIFVVRNGTVFTPPVTDSILEGITRDTLIELCRNELGIEVVERSIDRSELYAADEIFFSGTAVGVGPVVEVDRRPIADGAIGRIAKALSEAYRDASLGKIAKYRKWVTPCFPALVAGRT
jgi:branched-chain amino acid aminotransferase